MKDYIYFNLPTPLDIKNARERIAPYVHRTPL
jgi:hypothetical protein